MLFRWAILIPLVLCGVSAQTRTVCEALADLTDLNGHEVKIRGAFIRGDTGQELFAWPPCPQPTVRDGWVWRDIIQVWPVDGQGSVTGALATYHEMAKAHRDCDIVVTLEGRLETRDHFDSKLYGDGLLHPIGFKWSVAQLAYRSMSHFEAVRLKPGEVDQWLEIHRKPWAERVQTSTQ